jgi:hypothetical protein
VEWNKNVAARLAPLPGLELGLLETNGHQNYTRWQEMKSYFPYSGVSWSEARGGIFELNDDYYRSSGGIYAPLPHYQRMYGLAKTR